MKGGVRRERNLERRRSMECVESGRRVNERGGMEFRERKCLKDGDKESAREFEGGRA